MLKSKMDEALTVCGCYGWVWGIYVRDTNAYRLGHGGKVSAAGIFPWPVPRDKGPRNRIFVLRDGLREDS